MTKPLDVLIVEDSEDDALLVVREGANDFVMKSNLVRLGLAIEL